MKTNLFLNFSNRPLGNTRTLIDALSEEEDVCIFVKSYIECLNCNKCVSGNCPLKDYNTFASLVDTILQFENILS